MLENERFIYGYSRIERIFLFISALPFIIAVKLIFILLVMIKAGYEELISDFY